MNKKENQLGLMSLPAELLAHIASQLRNVKDLAALNATCFTFHNIISREASVWVSHAKRWGYARGITFHNMNLVIKAYLVLWIVRGGKTTRSIPIVGIVYDVVDPVALRDIKLTPGILKEFKTRINATTTCPFPHYTKEEETWGDFCNMTPLSDEEIFEQAKSCWAIGPLGKNFNHLVILEYAIQHCFSVVKMQPSPEAQFVLLFEPTMCGLALSAILAELKCRAYHIGSKLCLEDKFGKLVTLFPSVVKRGKRKAILELQKQYAAIDATEEPWCLINLLLPPKKITL